MKTIVVVGGGITGLASMYELHKWKQMVQSDVRLILVEASSKLGGKIDTITENGFVMEAGADSIVTRKMQGLHLLEELGLEDKIVYNATGRSFIYREGELQAIPEDAVFGIPAGLESLAKSTLISAEGKVAALRDFYTKNDRFTANDSIGSFLQYFLGEELVQKQIAPVLSGVYSGSLSDLTIGSTLPYLLDYKEKYGSIMQGLKENLHKFKSGGDKKFLSFAAGLNELINRLEEKLVGVEIVKGTKTSKLDKIGNCYQVLMDNETIIEADHVVLSIPHTAASQLFDEEQLQQDFSKLKTSSLISIYLGFDVSDSQLPAEGTGFITANNNELSCNACTWTSRKWEHTSKTGNLLVRLFYKSSHPSFNTLKEMREEDLLQVALTDIEKSLGITAKPVSSVVTNWADSMPNYQITHPETVNSLENRLKELYPGIKLAGCSYYGVGIPDCIENGFTIAKDIIKSL